MVSLLGTVYAYEGQEVKGDEIMGWGCRKHEMDAGSKAWIESSDKLLAQEEKKGYPRWGRDVEICPLCYEELSGLLEKSLSLAAELLKDATDLSAALLDDVEEWSFRAYEFLGVKGDIFETK